jgi:hypothetical protein
MVCGLYIFSMLVLFRSYELVAQRHEHGSQSDFGDEFSRAPDDAARRRGTPVEFRDYLLKPILS